MTTLGGIITIIAGLATILLSIFNVKKVKITFINFLLILSALCIIVFGIFLLCYNNNNEDALLSKVGDEENSYNSEKDIITTPNEISSYENNKPLDTICLKDLERASFGNYTGNLGDSCINILGEEFEYGYGNIGVNGEVFKNGFEVWIARWNNLAEKSWAFATYELDSKYKELYVSTGLIQSYNTENFSTEVIIFGDEKILYSQTLTADEYMFEFKVPMDNVNELKIMLKDNVAVEGGTSFALYNLYLTY